MAATNYTPIQLYYSTTASTAPVAGNLTSGELAINITDGKLYYKDNGGVVQVLATKGTGSIGGATTQIQYNNAGALAGNAAMTFNSGTSTTTLTTLNLTNALGAIYGGTAQSAYTQGDILYSSATNTLSKLGIGTVNYILTSTGSVPQWVAPTSVTVQTANNLAGGLAGSVPYQSAVDTTTFLAIGAANRIMSSSGTAPQWVTALTGLTGVSSSSITNTSLTSGRVVISSTAGLEADSANLTFNGTTLSTTGLSNTGFSTLVKTLTLGDSNFNGTAVFSLTAPAKLYIGTGTVTDTTSAIGATNAAGAISSLAITPIAATNTSVTYTNAATLYIAGAPSAGTNVTINNPYSLYVASGNVFYGASSVTQQSSAVVTHSMISSASSAVLNLSAPTGAGAYATQITFQSSGTSKWAIGGGNIGTGGANDFGMYDYANSRLIYTVLAANGNMLMNTNLQFVDNTYDIGNSGGLRPRNLYLAGDAYIAGSTTLSGGTANGVAYLNGSKVLTTGSALTFDGSNFGVSASVATATLASSGAYSALTFTNSGGATKAGLILTNSSGILQSRAETLAWTNYDASSEYMRLTSTGLGIGTTLPTTKLTVSSSFSGKQIEVISTGSASYLYNTVGANSSVFGQDSTGTFIGDLGTKPIYFYTNSAEQMRLTSTGLGIGTSSPTGRLTVLRDVTGATSNTTEQVSIFNSATGVAGNQATIGFHLNNSNWGPATTYARVSAVLENGTTGATALAFGTAPDGSLTTAPERMRLDSSGNLMIATTGAYGRLSVSGGTVALITDVSTERRLSFWSTANTNSENAYIQVQNDGATTNTGEMLFATKNQGGTLAERARLTSAGLFGISTNNPTAGFANYQTTSQISSGNSTSTGLWNVTNTTTATNNATTDVLRLLNANGALLNGYVAGHVYINATGNSGGNGLSAIYALNTTSNGASPTAFTLVSSVSRGTNPLSSVAITGDGVGGAVKVQVTWINDSGVVTGGGCIASFVGLAS
jgi:hypothetical protein